MRDPAVRRMGIYHRQERTLAPAVLKFMELLRLEVAATLRRMEKA